jgi:ATP-dependent Clp protease ATP-binding subunit ClpC
MTGIPINSLTSVESEKLINLEATLHKRVIGQEEAITAISKALSFTLRNSKSKSSDC